MTEVPTTVTDSSKQSYYLTANGSMLILTGLPVRAHGIWCAVSTINAHRPHPIPRERYDVRVCRASIEDLPVQRWQADWSTDRLRTFPALGCVSFGSRWSDLGNQECTTDRRSPGRSSRRRALAGVRSGCMPCDPVACPNRCMDAAGLGHLHAWLESNHSERGVRDKLNCGA